jgi:hypothetical protein
MLLYRRYKSLDDGDYSTPGLFSVGKETFVFNNASGPCRPYCRLSFQSIAATVFVWVKQPVYEFDRLRVSRAEVKNAYFHYAFSTSSWRLS